MIWCELCIFWHRYIRAYYFYACEMRELEKEGIGNQGLIIPMPIF